MKRYLFIILTLIALSACSAIEEISNSITGDDTNNTANTGGDNTGGDNTGGDNTGGDNTGGDNTGGDNNTITGAHPETPTEFNKNSLTSFIDKKRNGRSNNALPTLAVQITRNSTDKKITSSKITGSVVEFDYAGDGEFADNYGLRFYFTDKKYEVTDGNGGENSVGGTTVNRGTSESPENFALSRNYYNGFYGFGFTANYMALISWTVYEASYDSKGYAITGYKTDGNDIPTIKTLKFIGKGGGQYYDANTSYATVFDITADVDFSKIY